MTHFPALVGHLHDGTMAEALAPTPRTQTLTQPLQALNLASLVRPRTVAPVGPRTPLAVQASETNMKRSLLVVSE